MAQDFILTSLTGLQQEYWVYSIILVHISSSLTAPLSQLLRTFLGQSNSHFSYLTLTCIVFLHLLSCSEDCIPCFESLEKLIVVSFCWVCLRCWFNLMVTVCCLADFLQSGLVFFAEAVWSGFCTSSWFLRLTVCLVLNELVLNTSWKMTAVFCHNKATNLYFNQWVITFTHHLLSSCWTQFYWSEFRLNKSGLKFTLHFL